MHLFGILAFIHMKSLLAVLATKDDMLPDESRKTVLPLSQTIFLDWERLG
jgi:hypothetical protein